MHSVPLEFIRYAGPPPLWNKLETTRIDLQFEKTSLVDVLAFIGSLSGLNLVLDPTIDAGRVEVLSLKSSTVRSTLEILCDVKGLDFDVKYGVVFLSKPVRLWSTDPALGLPAVNLWRTGTAGSGKSALTDKLRTARLTMDAQTSPLLAIALFIQEITVVKVVASPGIADTQLVLKVEDLPVEHALELLTLPYGWDARIDGESVVLFDPKQ